MNLSTHQDFGGTSQDLLSSHWFWTTLGSNIQGKNMKRTSSTQSRIKTKFHNIGKEDYTVASSSIGTMNNKIWIFLFWGALQNYFLNLNTWNRTNHNIPHTAHQRRFMDPRHSIPFHTTRQRNLKTHKSEFSNKWLEELFIAQHPWISQCLCH